MSTEPRAPQESFVHREQGVERADPYHWMRTREDARLIPHLEAENAHCDAVMAPHQELKATILAELKGRIKDEDDSVPVPDGPWEYFHEYRAGAEHECYQRFPRGGTKEQAEVVLDCEALAKESEYFDLGELEWSPDHQRLAYAVDTDGSEQFTIKVLDLSTGKLLSDELKGAYYGLEWDASGEFLFYVELNENQRPYRVRRHRLGTKQDADPVVLEEPDARFFMGLGKGQAGQHLFVQSEGVNTSEVWMLPADQPTDEFRSLRPREFGVEYSVDWREGSFYFLTNKDTLDFRLEQVPDSDLSASAQVVVPEQRGRLLQDFLALKDRILIATKEDAREALWQLDAQGQLQAVPMPEQLISVGFGANYEYDTHMVRLGYSSPVTPPTTLDLDLNTGAQTVRKVKEIPSGYDASLYVAERLYGTSEDGTKVPMTIVRRKDTPQDGNRPVYLWGYGAYGIGQDPGFATNWLSFLDRGFVAVMAHIRGGDDCGRDWYEQGKLAHKQNTFRDFIACAEGLIAAGWTKPGRIVGVGGSAGGMLIGAVANMRPDLWGGLVAHVPFVDCLSTMLDESLPLTGLEYNEWGDPRKKDEFDRIHAYSPFENVREQNYPPFYITAGLNDPRVTYWEPTKWVARLRDRKTDPHPVLYRVNMGAGHGGVSGRYAALAERAEEYAWVIQQVGV